MSEMLFCPVPLMREKIVLGINPVILGHQSIPSDLRHNRRSRDGETESIPLDDGTGRNRTTGKRDRVDQETIRRRRKPGDRPVHGETRSLQDVEPINLLLARQSDPDAGGPFYDHSIQSLPYGFGELFGVVATNETATGRQHNGRCYDRSGQRTAACFVEAGDAAVAATPGF